MQDLTDAAPRGDEHVLVDERERRVTDEVLASFDDTPDERLREILRSLVEHLHGFARDVRLTEAEWTQGIEFLTRVGHITDDRRQEFILLSDVLGLSMLTVGINAPDEPEATESTVFGPFFVEDSPEIELGGDIAEGVSGEPCWVEGRVTAVDGSPLAGAKIEVWEADDDGFYDVQQGETLSGRAHLFADDEGRYGFWSVKPAPYPIPDDGPVGDLLKAARRSPYRPAHIHFMVSHPGHQTLITHVFIAGSPHLDDDAVFGVKASLIAPAEQQAPGEGPGGRTLDAPWWRMTFDLRLA